MRSKIIHIYQKKKTFPPLFKNKNKARCNYGYNRKRYMQLGKYFSMMSKMKIILSC